MDLNKLNIINTEYDLGTGFFWVEFENGKVIQCCLEIDEKDNYMEVISKSKNGFYWGVCGEVNEWAADNKEWDHINNFLIKQAHKAGLQIIS